MSYQDPYGASPYGYGYGYYPVSRPTNGLALASMIVSICALVICGGAIGIVGAIMGHVARKQVRERGEEGDGFALAGVIVGWIGFGLFLAFIAFYAIVIAAVFATAPDVTDPSYSPYDDPYD